MWNLLIILSLVLVCSATTHLTMSSVMLSSDLRLANFLLKQQTQANNVDAATSAQCFSLYLPLLNDVANSWSSNYSACITNANNERDAVMTEMQNEQNSISNTASGVCQFVTNCQSIDDTMSFFNCFEAFSSNVLNTVYTISNNASDDAILMSQELESIDESMYKCTNNTERTFVAQNAKVYDALDYCLRNGLPPVENPTTVAPIETTETIADSTEVTDSPSSSDEPTAETTIKVKAQSSKRSLSLALVKLSRKFGN